MVDRKHARDKSKQQKTIARQKIPSSVVDDPDPLTVLLVIQLVIFQIDSIFSYVSIVICQFN